MEHSERILQIMEARGVTAYRVAKDAGVSESVFSEWRRKPSSNIYSKWAGRCAACGAWNTLVEERVPTGNIAGTSSKRSRTGARALAVNEIEALDEPRILMPSGPAQGIRGNLAGGCDDTGRSHRMAQRNRRSACESCTGAGGKPSARQSSEHGLRKGGDCITEGSGAHRSIKVMEAGPVGPAEQ